MKIEAVERLAGNLAWTRDTLLYYLREIGEESRKAEEQEVADNLQEYREILRQIVLDIGALLDRIAVDREVGDPSFSQEIRRYLGRGGQR